MNRQATERPAWMPPPPEPGDSLRVWQAWKHLAMTASQEAFVARNPWFTFRKEEIFEHLGGTFPVPRLLYRSKAGAARRFSSVLAALDVPRSAERLIVKGSQGHSCREVKVLDLADWPHRARCLLHKADHAPGELDAWLRDRPYVIEQAISCAEEPVPRDFKVYVRCGEPRIVVSIDRNGPQAVLTFIDGRTWLKIPGSEVYAGRFPPQWRRGGRLSDELVARAHRAAAFAAQVVRAVHAEDLFVGIDTYVPADAPETVWLGEITPRMGALHGNWLRVRFMQYLFLDAAPAAW